MRRWLFRFPNTARRLQRLSVSAAVPARPPCVSSRPRRTVWPTATSCDPTARTLAQRPAGIVERLGVAESGDQVAPPSKLATRSAPNGVCAAAVPINTASTCARRANPVAAKPVVWQTTVPAPTLTAPGLASAAETAPVSAVPSRFMNAAIDSLTTLSVGQYSVALVQPRVTARFFSHSTFGQKVLPESTSVKVLQAWPDTAVAVCAVVPSAGPLAPSPE